MKKSVDGLCEKELLDVDEKVFVPVFLVKVIRASILLSLRISFSCEMSREQHRKTPP